MSARPETAHGASARSHRRSRSDARAMATATASHAAPAASRPQVQGIAGALARPLVTHDPARAGLESHTPADVRAGRARGIVCGGGMGAGHVETVPLGCHGIVLGHTGSGKTRLIVEPTCIVNARRGERIQPHIVSLDCKGTVRRETEALLAAEGYRIETFDLAATSSPARWNPLSDMHRALMAGNGADADLALSRLAVPLKSTVRDDGDRYWAEAAWDAIAGVAKALSLYRECEPTMGDVYDTICDTALLRTLDQLLDDRAPSGLHAAVQLTNVERTWSCVRSTCASMLAFFATGAGRAVSGASTVDFARDLLASRKPRAYYIVVPDTSSAADGYAGLLVDALYQTYCAEHDRRRLEDTGKARPVLIILDEFARLPRLDITSAMSAGRSRDVSVLIILQSIAQLTERGTYRPEEARVMLEQSGATIYLQVTSPEAGRDAELKSGGMVGAHELMLLPRGSAYVSRAGRPMIKTTGEPFDAWAKALARPSRKG